MTTLRHVMEGYLAEPQVFKDNLAQTNETVKLRERRATCIWRHAGKKRN